MASTADAEPISLPLLPQLMESRKLSRFTPPLNSIVAFIRNDPTCILEWNQTLEVCKEAVLREPKCFPFIREHSKELLDYVLPYWPHLSVDVHITHTQ